jgi:hypothetical protein
MGKKRGTAQKGKEFKIMPQRSSERMTLLLGVSPDSLWVFQ